MGFSLAARARRSSWWYARCRLPQRLSPLPVPPLVMMPSRGTTTTEMGGLPARKHVGTGSPRSRVRTLPFASCETGMVMVSCASSGAYVDVCFPLVAPCRDAVFSC